MSAIVSNLFIEQSVVFDTRNLNVNQVPLPDISQLFQKDEEVDSTFPKGRFGLLTLKAITTPLTTVEQDFMFQIDCSGSMSDRCADGRTKMQHILHTLKNMILYFKENPSLKVHVTIHAFDDNIYNILNRILVDDTSYNKIITTIDTIVPRSCTNIEKALKNAREYMAQLIEQYPTTTKTHIFMTDGQATAGNQTHEILRELVDNNVNNIFIGFGLDHDARLLHAVSEGEKSNYYFVDKLENAGLVYGEILHGLVYKFLENVEISVTDGLIYDYKTNIWNNTLKVGEIVSESNKFYHLVSNDICTVQVTGKRIDDVSDILVMIPSQEESVDLTKYIYRQRTQQLLFKINDYNKNNNNIVDYTVRKEQQKKLKTEMQEFFEELKKYMSDTNLTDDILMKNLCDDIYICHRTFGTQLGDMFCNARESSQGQQRAYTATHIPDNQANERCLRRQNGICRSNAFGGFANDEYTEEDEDEEYTGLHHQITSSTDTPYRSQSMTQVMRSVSCGNNDDEEEEETQIM